MIKIELLNKYIFLFLVKYGLHGTYLHTSRYFSMNMKDETKNKFQDQIVYAYVTFSVKKKSYSIAFEYKSVLIC